MKGNRPAQNSRRAIFCAILYLFTTITLTTTANERPTRFVHRTLSCGSVQVTSDTLLLDLNDNLEARGLSQEIRLTDLSARRSVALPLFQRWTADRELHRRKLLDGLIWAFECVTAHSGRSYVMLLWACTNPRSKTCEAAMTIQDEWKAFYDNQGRPLPPDPRNVTPADEEKIKHLGLFSPYIQDNLERDGGFTYFYKQVAPNGHIQ